MDRLANFKSLKTHAWFNRVYKKLNAADIKFCEEYLNNNKHLDKNEFEFKVVRIFLDNPNKPKNWTLIQELLANSNV